MSFNSKIMTLNQNGRVKYLTYNKLSEINTIKHAFSTKFGGVSTGDCAEMNLAFGRGDSVETVLENYKIFCDATGFDTNTLVASAQDHNTVVRTVTTQDCGVGIYKPRDMQSVDALITNQKGVTLVTYYADCTPIFFVDTKTNAIGLAHAGWRGTVAKICANVVSKMKAEFGTNANDLICAIGPAISKCCYEVDKPVADQFKIAFNDHSKIVFDVGNDKYMLDLLQANKQILLESGVSPNNIIISDICTKCNSDLLWSHRATNGKRGTMSAFLALT